MDRRERTNALDVALRAAFDGKQAEMWCALPGIIESVDLGNAMTCVVQPALQGRVQAKDGTFSWQTMPLCVDVPVLFQSGGGFTLTFPIKKNDECLIIFSSRCIDAWWQSGGIGVQAELRMHDLSDGFALVGPRSLPNTIDGISTTATQLRSDDGSTYVEVAEGTIKLKAPTSVTIDSPLTTLTGDLVVQGKGTITKLFSYLAGLAGFAGAGTNSISGGLNNTGGMVTSNGKVLETHTHSDPQGGNTGPPN